jgi:hypothetical protein
MSNSASNVLTLLLVEGDTDQLFYERVKSALVPGRCAVEVIGGLWNVNKKILCALARRRDEQIRAYCCLDKESRYAPLPVFDLKFIRRELKERGIANVLSVDAIVAVQMLESWFFHDLDGIYRYLQAPKSKRNMKAYDPVEALRDADLMRLFRQHGKEYEKGRRAKHFIDRLDVHRILERCPALREGIAKMRHRAKR